VGAAAFDGRRHVLNRSSEKRAAEDHETLMMELAEIKEMHTNSVNCARCSSIVPNPSMMAMAITRLTMMVSRDMISHFHRTSGNYA